MGAVGYKRRAHGLGQGLVSAPCSTPPPEASSEGTNGLSLGTAPGWRPAEIPGPLAVTCLKPLQPLQPLQPLTAAAHARGAVAPAAQPPPRGAASPQPIGCSPPPPSPRSKWPRPAPHQRPGAPLGGGAEGALRGRRPAVGRGRAVLRS